VTSGAQDPVGDLSRMRDQREVRRVELDRLGLHALDRRRDPLAARAVDCRSSVCASALAAAAVQARTQQGVRAVVVDGVLDPIAWSTGRGDEAATLPFSTRL
jgi:hypothetical protein